ncbi:nucleoside hydrolase [Kribbella sp. NPDC051952]|uniref:nucleoside hydrolase n=1 Tax=Kribbella sp. NPDC051952 TaxID=3154851 RepID=UPI00344314EE
MARWVRRLWVMGGSFGPDAEPEHNFRSDEAAQTVLNAGIPTTVTGLEITQRVSIDSGRLERIRAAGALGAALGGDIEQWWAHWNKTWNVRHDPVAVLTLTRPDLFTFSAPGRIDITLGTGLSAFVADPAGTVRIATDLDTEAVAEEITTRIVAAGG